MNSSDSIQPIVGILAMQGDYDAHRKIFEERLDTGTSLVRTVGDLKDVDALILPGGESTTIIKLLARIGLDIAIKERAHAGMCIYGTCAGMILLAKHIKGRSDQPTLQLMDIEVERNAFGRQVDSFEAEVSFEPVAGSESPYVRGVFIRAPYVTELTSDVTTLCRYQDKIVGVRQKNMLATAFHPELTNDTRIHSYFLKMVTQQKETR